MAGLFNAAVRLLNKRLRARITDLHGLIADETDRGHALRTAPNFADSDRSGYIDRRYREAP
ncbi:hypothetical protein [Streptomyces sp. NPDC003832]